MDAPIIVNNTVDEFYKQPMFYAMGHFSKYIPEYSVRIDLQFIDNTNSLFATAFLQPGGKRTIAILNRYLLDNDVLCRFYFEIFKLIKFLFWFNYSSDEEKVISMLDVDRVGTLEFISPSRSLHTVLYMDNFFTLFDKENLSFDI